MKFEGTGGAMQIEVVLSDPDMASARPLRTAEVEESVFNRGAFGSSAQPSEAR